MNPYRYVGALAWCGPLMLVVTVLFWGVLGHNIPPYSPGLDAEAFAAQIRAHALEIRLGMILQMPCSVMYFLWGLSITKVMQAVERANGDNDVMSTLQLWGAGFTTIVFVVPCAVWLTVAYRPDVMDPKTLQIMYDFGWFFFDMAYSLTTLQTVAIGICFLSDKRDQPLVPGWAAWLTMWVGISFVLESMMPLVFGGPFARSGLLNYWIEFSLFFLMMLVLSIYVIKAVGRLQREHKAGHAAG